VLIQWYAFVHAASSPFVVIMRPAPPFLLAACTFVSTSHPSSSLRSCRMMATNRDAPPPTKSAAVEEALAARGTQPAILLARPFASGNIGAVARAMLNFGFSELRIVQPLNPEWQDEEAMARACGAAPLLEEATTYNDMRAATEDLQMVLATTARPRDANVEVLTARDAAKRAAQAVAAGQRVGLLFGSEKNGLSNEELTHATTLVTVPTNPLFSSLNLAQAVLLLSYEYSAAAAELRQQPPPPRSIQADGGAAGGDDEGGAPQPARRGFAQKEDAPWRDAPAPMGGVHSMVDAWEEGLWWSGFFGAGRSPSTTAAEDATGGSGVLGGNEDATVDALVEAATEQERVRARATMDKLRRVIVRSAPTQAEMGLLRGALQALLPREHSSRSSRQSRHFKPTRAHEALSQD